MIGWIVLAVMHIVVIGLWWWLGTLPNRGTGGLGDALLPVFFTIIVIVVDIIVILYQLYKYFFTN
jgi:hypothetical protein